MPGLSLNPYNSHVVDVEGRAMLFHVPTTGLFELDEVGAELLELFSARTTITPQDIRAHFTGRYPAADVIDTLHELRDLQVVQSQAEPIPYNRKVTIDGYPLSTIVLNVNTGCNLSCSYCYKEDLATPANGARMDFETARRGIELLLDEGRARSRINVVFFGGEPLTNMPLIRRVVDYTEKRCREENKSPDFSLTTNATLLTESLIEYFDDHRFGLSVSMDGPQTMHDMHRRTVGGKGTYATVSRKVRLLLCRYRSRPVGARVTLTAGVTDVETIHEHLHDELGFFEVGFAPVTSGALQRFNLSAEELETVHGGFERLGRRYLDAALRGENIGFSNMHQLMTDLYEGTRKTLPCGAGLGMLAVDNNGELNLCHRFTGSELDTFGDVDDGIDKARLGLFLESAGNRDGTHCATCRIRNICAGGCYHESYARYGDTHHRTYHYCNLLRNWVDFGIYVYARIRQQNPSFFEQHIMPRRSPA